MRALLLALLLLREQHVSAEDDDYIEPEYDMEIFRAEVEPLVRQFIFSKYDRFAASRLTFRHLKQHVAKHTQFSYEDLTRDDRSEVIETTTDEIANNCDMGSVELAECKQRIGYEEPEPETKEARDEL